MCCRSGLLSASREVPHYCSRARKCFLPWLCGPRGIRVATADNPRMHMLRSDRESRGSWHRLAYTCCRRSTPLGRQSCHLPARTETRNAFGRWCHRSEGPKDRKSTRLNSSHSQISYAVFCLKKKNKNPAFVLTSYIANHQPHSPLDHDHA